MIGPEAQFGANSISPSLHIPPSVSGHVSRRTKTYAIIANFHHEFHLRIARVQTYLCRAAMLDGVAYRLLDDAEDLDDGVLLNERDGLDIEIRP